MKYKVSIVTPGKQEQANGLCDWPEVGSSVSLGERERCVKLMFRVVARGHHGGKRGVGKQGMRGGRQRERERGLSITNPRSGRACFDARFDARWGCNSQAHRSIPAETK